MNLNEQIAKEVILSLSKGEEKNKFVDFFETYESWSKLSGFSSDLECCNNFESIKWEIGNVNIPNHLQTAILFPTENTESIPDLKEKIGKVVKNVTNSHPLSIAQKAVNKVDSSERELISDGFHTFKELYETRLALTALLFNLKEEYLQNKYGMGIISREDYDKFKPYKSKKHSDGELCFGGGWFITGFLTELGQVSFHYEMKDWDLFNIKEVEQAPEWDGHTTQDVINRLKQI